MAQVARFWRARLRPIVEHLREHDLMLHAGGLAFYALITVVPSLLVMAWAASLFVSEEQLERFGERIAELAPEGVEAEESLQNAVQVGTGLGIGALVAALWPATAYGGGLVRAFDHVAGHEHRRTALRGRAKSLSLLILLPAISLGALGTSYLIGGIFDEGVAALAGWFLALLGGFVAASIVCALIYWLFSPERPGVRAVIAGAVFVAAGMAIVSLGFVVYVEHGADYEDQVAGAGAATLILVALWAYLANLLLLIGFMVVRAAAGQEGPLGDLAEDVLEADRRE